MAHLPSVGELLWVRHGVDKFWPAIVESTEASHFEVLFVEANMCYEDYLAGTVNVGHGSIRKWVRFTEGIELCQAPQLHFHPWSDPSLQLALAWIKTTHSDLLPPELLTGNQAAQISQRAWCSVTAQQAVASATCEETKQHAQTTRRGGAGKPAGAAASLELGGAYSDWEEVQIKAQQVAADAVRKTIGVAENAHREPNAQAVRGCRTEISTDDLNNTYGSLLFHDPADAPKIHKHNSDPGCEKLLKELSRALAAVEGGAQYEVCKLTQSGSDANIHAIADACGGDLSRCLIAAGTYVVGDNSTLRHLSTSGGNTGIERRGDVVPQDA